MDYRFNSLCKQEHPVHPNPGDQIVDKPLRVLILEDNPTDAELAQFELQEAGLAFTAQVVAAEKDYHRALTGFSPDLILSDYDLPRYNGALALAAAKTKCPDIPFILVSGVISEDRAIEILTQGAKDYVLKNRLQQRLVPAVRRAIAEAEEIRTRKRAEAELREAHRLLEAQVQERTAELQESRERLSLALSSSGMGTFDWNIAEGIRYWDDNIHLLMGIPREGFLGTTEELFRAIHPEDRDGVREALARAIEQDSRYRIEYRVVWPDGSVHHVATRGMVQRDDAGRAVRAIGVCWDITDLKQAEEEREKLQAQLLQSQKMESIGRLAGGVAHDFNNMLGVILGHAELALERIDPGQPLHSDLQEIRKAAERSTELARQLLAFARKQTISPRVLDLNETVGGMLKMLWRLIGEDIDLSWLPGGDLWPVKMDPSQVNQILANLCVNARDAIPGVGRITIETGNAVFDEAYGADQPGYVPGDYALLAVSDDGCGMDKETLGKLFEPFFTTKELGKGTGLGLATVYGIVKQNSGFINVYSEPGQGTTFRIYLPRHAGKTEQERPAAPREAVMRGRETILVVEDEPEILNLARLMLERQGYQVLSAGTPGEAIRTAERHHGEIHLLMTDVVMPEMNGRDLAKQIFSSYPNIKRLFMSGYTANVIAHHGVLDEGVHFIQKPFSIKALTAKVRQTLDEA
jgi:PAS domain S-box-containing protein